MQESAEMDPRKAECHGFFLYGAGYFARDDNTLGLVRGVDVPTHFCLECPVMASCEQAQHRRVQEQQPEALARFEHIVKEGMRRGLSELLCAVSLAQRGQNPYYEDAIANWKRGHADRGKITGPLVHPRDGR